MINQVFLPTVAEFPEDISISWELQKPLLEAGYQRGLMLVIRKGMSGLTSETAMKQRTNLAPYAAKYGKAPIIVMCSNIPIEEMDWLHNPDGAFCHVKTAVDFAKNLPLGGRRIVTFHLNSLVPKDTPASDYVSTMNQMPKMIIALSNAAKYAASHGVELKVETVPVPEFGDLTHDHPLAYLGVKARDLRNPFYLVANDFQWVRRSGLGICLDICHNRTIYRSSDKVRNGQPVTDDTFLWSEMRGSSLMDDVRALESSDIVHLNDGSGIYTPEGGAFLEGMALGRGDIREIPGIVNHLNLEKIPFVLEINETDFKERPNTKTSIRYLLNLL